MKLYFIKDIKKTNKNCKEYSGTKYYVDTGSVIQNEIVNSEEFDFCSKPSRANVCVNTGDVLFAKMQNSIKVIEVNESNKHYIFSTGFYCFSDKRIHPSYLRHYFLSKIFNQKKDKLCNGSTMKAINDDGMSKIYIDVPSMLEQQKCVVILNELEKSIKKCEAEIEKMSEIVKSRFNEIFVDKGFGVKPIRYFINKDKISAKKIYSESDCINYVDISSIDNSKNEIVSSTKYVFKDAPSRAQQCLKKKDILVSTVRPNLKNIALFDLSNDGYVGSSGFCVLRPVKCNPYYLKFVILTDDFTDKMISLTTGASYPAIRDNDVFEYQMIDSPIDLQNEFGEFVEMIDKSKFILQKQKKNLEELYDSKLHEYFGD